MPQPTTTLDTIKQKVRRLTRTPSLSQLSDFDLEQYINTFVVYDFPEHLRTFNLRQPFTFICNPFQDEYSTDEAAFLGATANPLYDFQNKYVTVHPPVYVAGFQALYSQSREQFFQIYPKINSIQSTGFQGDGATTRFTGVINSFQGQTNGFNQQICLLPREVLFSSIDGFGEGLALIDVPLVDALTGNTVPAGNLYVPGTEPAVGEIVTDIDPNNNINYLTGEYTITFGGDTPVAPAANAAINSQTVPQQPSIPMAMLYYNNKFTLRPIPDQPYRINFEVFANPVALLAGNQSPELKEYWQYIALGAARKILQDRMDMDTVALIEPEYRKQEMLCMRRTLVQYANERTATIYSEQTGIPGGDGWGRGGGLF